MIAQYQIPTAPLRFSAAGEAASVTMDGMLANKRSPTTARKSPSMGNDYGLVLALGLFGLVLTAVLAISLATDPVLLAWASPM